MIVFQKRLSLSSNFKIPFFVEISPENIIVGNLLIEESNSDGILLQEDCYSLNVIVKFCTCETQAKPLKFTRILP